MSMSSILLGNVSYALLDSGLANILGLETLNHGTNLLNYLNIRLYGADPAKGGNPLGSTANYFSDNTENFFYVFKDSEIPKFADLSSSNLSLDLSFSNLSLEEKIAHISYSIKGFPNRILPLMHKTLSTINLLKKTLPSYLNSDYSNCLISILMLPSIPTLRFRFAIINENVFENDPCYLGLAYRTRKFIEASRIGLLGTIKSGLNKEWFSRVKAKPYKVLTGVAQLICFVGLTALSISTIVANPYAAAFGALIS